MEVTVTPVADVRPDEMDEWKRLAQKVHPPDETRLGGNLRWADLDKATDYLIRAREDGTLRSCGWVTRRTIAVGGEAITVAGIRGVQTDPAARRRGYGRAVMLAAHDLMRSFGDCDYAMLFSSEMAVPFYKDLGWQEVQGPVMCDQPEGRINYTTTLPPSAPVMMLMLRDLGALPTGPIEVHGFPW